MLTDRLTLVQGGSEGDDALKAQLIQWQDEKCQLIH